VEDDIAGNLDVKFYNNPFVARSPFKELMRLYSEHEYRSNADSRKVNTLFKKYTNYFLGLIISLPLVAVSINSISNTHIFWVVTALLAGLYTVWVMLFMVVPVLYASCKHLYRLKTESSIYGKMISVELFKPHKSGFCQELFMTGIGARGLTHVSEFRSSLVKQSTINEARTGIIVVSTILSSAEVMVTVDQLSNSSILNLLNIVIMGIIFLIFIVTLVASSNFFAQLSTIPKDLWMSYTNSLPVRVYLKYKDGRASWEITKQLLALIVMGLYLSSIIILALFLRVPLPYTFSATVLVLSLWYPRYYFVRGYLAHHYITYRREIHKNERSLQEFIYKINEDPEYIREM
jgi:hypothetical protein